MASDAERRSTTLDREKKRKWGYSVDQVDMFLEKTHALYEAPEPRLTQEDIQRVSFDLERGGYVIDQVDAALARLETAVVDKQTQWDIEHQGRVAWRGRTEQLAQTLYGRADRPDRERFAKADQGKSSYDFRQVDRLVAQAVGVIRRKLAEEHGADVQPQPAGTQDITSAQVAASVFTRRHGKHGYDERSVDFYLNRVGQVLLRLESFARLSDSLKETPSAPVSEHPSAAPAPSAGSVFDQQDVMRDPAPSTHVTEEAMPPVVAAEVPPSAPALVAEEPHADGAADSTRTPVESSATSVPPSSIAASAAGTAADAGEAMPPSFRPSASFDSLREAEASIFHAKPASGAVSNESMFPHSMTAVPVVRPAAAPDAGDAPAMSAEPRTSISTDSGASRPGMDAPRDSQATAAPAVEPQPAQTEPQGQASPLPPSFPPLDAPTYHAMPTRSVAHEAAQPDDGPDSFVFPTTPMVLDAIAAPRHGATTDDAPSFPPISVPATPTFPVIPIAGERGKDGEPASPSMSGATAGKDATAPEAQTVDDPKAQAKAYVDRLMGSEFTTTDFEIPKLSFPAIGGDDDSDKGGTRA